MADKKIMIDKRDNFTNITAQTAQEQIKYTKQEYHWHYVCMYLQALEKCQPIMADEEFRNAFEKLCNCAESKIKLAGDSEDILATYVVVEQKISKK